MFRLLVALGCGGAALAQQYTITTVAGGAPPPTPASALATSIGKPNRVALDSGGNLYFSASNAVFRMNAGGELTLVAGNSRAGFSGDGGPAARAQLNNPQGIAIDSAGNIYIADAGNNRVRMVSAEGIVTTFAGSGNRSLGGPGSFNDGAQATDALMSMPMGVAVARSGLVYIAVASDNNVRVVGTDGIIHTFAGDSLPSYAGDDGPAVRAELNKPSDVAIDSSGNVYIADTSNAVVRKVGTDGIITTFAGTGGIGFTGDGGAATDATMISPLSLTLDSAGNLYIVQNGDSRIRKVDTQGVITTIAGTGSAGFGGDGSAATGAQLNYPTGIIADGSGNLYIADSLNLRVRKIAGSNISSVAGNGRMAYSGDGGPATGAQMNGPQGVAVDAAGNIYVAEAENHVVRRIAPDGMATTFAGNGQAGFTGDGGAASSAQLNSPLGVAVDFQGNVYISDSQNARVRRVSADGTITTFAGNGTQGYGGDGGAAAGAQLYTPAGLAVDAGGQVYIADLNNNRIRRVDAFGNIATVAGTGNSGFSGDGGPATEAQIHLPRAVAVDAAGGIYIADSGNNRVRLVSPAGQMSTLAGNGMLGFGGDNGPANRAQVGPVSGVAVDAGGNVYIVDGGARIRKVYAGGFIATIAGTGVLGYSGDGGAALSARINGPSGIAVDSNGNIYFSDTGNQAVRVLQSAGFALTMSAVTNGASNQMGAISPGEVVVLYGTGLGPSALIQATLNAAGAIPTSLAGTVVYFNDAPSPILYTSANQVGAIVPYGVTGTSARVFVRYQGQMSEAVSVNVAQSSPGLFTMDGSGRGQAIAVNQDRVLNDAAHPAPAGSVVTLYATGEGQTTPPGRDGVLAAIPLPQPVLPVSVTVGGRSANVQYRGGAPGIVAGVMQLNIEIPAGLTAGPVPVVLQVGGNSSQSNATIYVTGN